MISNGDPNLVVRTALPWREMDLAPASSPDKQPEWVLMHVPKRGVFFGYVREQNGTRSAFVDGVDEGEPQF